MSVTLDDPTCQWVHERKFLYFDLKEQYMIKSLAMI